MYESIFLLMLLSIIRLSTPIAIAGIGNMFSERVGILNLGANGMMLTGAFTAVVGSHFTGDPWIGVFCGMIGGGFAGFLHSVICVEFGGDQTISGLGINILAAGITTFFSTVISGANISPNVPSLQTSEWFRNIPVIGGFLVQLSPITYLSIFLIMIAYFIVYKTSFGLRMQALGDDPKTVETCGINVWRMKHINVTICGLLAGLAGAYMSIGQLDRFFEDMISGKGMLAVIAVKMGRWNPIGIIATALLLGFFDALQLQLQISNYLGIPPEIIQTIPYIAGIIALTTQSGSAVGPKSIDMAYIRNKFKF